MQGIVCSQNAGLDSFIRLSSNASKSSLTTIANLSGEFFLIQTILLPTFSYYNRIPNPTCPPGIQDHPHLPFGPSPSPIPTLRPPRPSHPLQHPPFLRTSGPQVKRAHCNEIAIPPSTNKLAPFTYFAISLAKKIHGPARSSGAPSRPRGTLRSWSAFLVGLERSSLLMFVRIVPGRELA